MFMLLWRHIYNELITLWKGGGGVISMAWLIPLPSQSDSVIVFWSAEMRRLISALAVAVLGQTLSDNGL